MHAAAAEPVDLAGGVQPGQRLAGGGQAAAGQVGLEAAEGLAGQDVQAYGDQRAGLRVEQPVRPGDPDQPVAAVAPGAVDRGDLGVLGVGVVDLAVALLDQPAQRGLVDQAGLADPVHALDQLAQRGGDDEVRRRAA